MNKLFILKISFLMCTIFFNLFNDITNKLIDLIKKQSDHFERILNVVERISNDNEELKNVADDHLKITSKLVDTINHVTNIDTKK